MTKNVFVRVCPGLKDCVCVCVCVSHRGDMINHWLSLLVNPLWGRCGHQHHTACTHNGVVYRKNIRPIHYHTHTHGYMWSFDTASGIL